LLKKYIDSILHPIKNCKYPKHNMNTLY